MRFSGLAMKTLSKDSAVAHQNTTDPGIWICRIQPLFSQLKSPSKKPAIIHWAEALLKADAFSRSAFACVGFFPSNQSLA